MYDPERVFLAAVAPLLEEVPPELAAAARELATDVRVRQSDRHAALALLRHAQAGASVAGRDVAAWLGHGARWGARALRRLRDVGLLTPGEGGRVWVIVAGEPVRLVAGDGTLVYARVRR